MDREARVTHLLTIFDVESAAVLTVDFVLHGVPIFLVHHPLERLHLRFQALVIGVQREVERDMAEGASRGAAPLRRPAGLQ